jgi:hypothetical protein
MSPSSFRIIVAISLSTLSSLSVAQGTGEADESSSKYLPPSTALYLEVPRPAELLSLIFDHPLREKIESLEPYRAATNSQPYKRFLLARTVVEGQVEMPWREALETFLAHGLVLAVDRETEGTALVIHGKDEASMRLLRDKLIEFAKLDANPDRLKQGSYRGIDVQQFDKIAFAAVGSRLFFTNQKELGKDILDRMLDGGESLADQSGYRSARETQKKALLAWGYADVESLRDAGVARNVFFDQINQPVAELIFGGIQSSLQKTPHATASLAGDHSGLRLAVEMPHQADWVPDSRDYYFGPEGAGRARGLPDLPETLFALSTYRNFSEMWLRAGDLFNADVNDGIAQADANLTTLFAGRDFGEDILGSFEPEARFIAVRQGFDPGAPTPTIKLPAFAAIFELRDPDTMTRELRRTFQSLVGFLNVVGAMNGQHQLELGSEAVGSDGELVTATYVPEVGEEDSTDAKIVFNFSPSLGFVGDRCVVASSVPLARALIEHQESEPEGTDDNTRAKLHANVLRDVLADNRSQLVAQNMLEEGNTKEQAEANIDLLLQVIGYLRGANASLQTTDGTLRFQLSVEVTHESSELD